MTTDHTRPMSFHYQADLRAEIMAIATGKSLRRPGPAHIKALLSENAELRKTIRDLLYGRNVMGQRA